jgi:hypothetical protein
VRVATTRSSIYINFGTSVVVSASRSSSAIADNGKFSDNPKGLEQALVRVRGWIEQRSGEPSIDLSTAGDIEVTAEGVASETAERRTERRSRTK